MKKNILRFYDNSVEHIKFLPDNMSYFNLECVKVLTKYIYLNHATSLYVIKYI